MALNFPAPGVDAENGTLNNMSINEMVMDVGPFGSGGIRTSYSSLRSYNYGTTSAPNHVIGGDALERKVRLSRSTATPSVLSRSYLLVDRKKTDTSLTAWTVNTVTPVTLTIPENLLISNIVPLAVPASVPPDPGKISRHEMALIPVELNTDIDNNGQVNSTDSSLAQGAYTAGATPAATDQATEFIFANDSLSNGAWDKDDTTTPGKPATATDDDDSEEIQIKLSGLPDGAEVWLEHPAIAGLSFYTSRKCLPAEKVNLSPSQHYIVSSTNPISKLAKLYVRADGTIPWASATDPQVEGDLKLMIKPGGSATALEGVKMKFTVVKELGASDYFKAITDSIFEQNLELFSSEITIASMKFRLCQMISENTQISCLNARQLADPPQGLMALVRSDTTAIINGNIVFHSGAMSRFERMTDRCHGRLVLPGGVFDSVVSSDDDSASGSALAGDTAKYFYQTLPTFGVGARNLIFDKGRLPTSGIPDMWSGMGGGSTNYASGDRQANLQMIGFAKNNFATNPSLDKGVVFTATSWQGSGQTASFANKCNASGVQQVPSGSPTEFQLLMLDGGSSIGLAHKLPDSTVGAIRLAIRQSSGIPEYTNVFINFASSKPRRS